jgi:predicted Zn-dependent protease
MDLSGNRTSGTALAMFRRFRQWFVSTRISPRRALLLVAAAGVLTAIGIFGGTYFWAERQIKAAERALEHRDYDEAQRRLDAVLRVRSDDARLHFLAARTARRAGRFGDARPHLAASLKFGYAPEAIKLEQALMEWQQGDRSSERYLLRRAEEDDPDSLLILEVLIQEYVDKFQLNEAKRCCNLYLTKKPDDVEALLTRARIYELLFYHAEAARDCRQAVQADPDNDFARLRLAEMLVITGPAEEAVEQFELLRPKKPNSARLLLGSARARMQLAQTEDARRDLDSLLMEEPNNAAALSERGKIDLANHKPAAAEAWLRRSLAQAPHDRQTVYNLVQCLDELGRTEDAATWRKKLEGIDADIAQIDAVTKAVLKSPNDPALRTEAGVLFLRNDQEEEGVRWLQMALKFDPTHQPAHRALAEYFREHGQAALADRHERLAGSTRP